MKRIAHAEETARRGKKDVDDRVDVDEEEGEKIREGITRKKASMGTKRAASGTR